MESDCDVELKKRLGNIIKMKDFLNDVDIRVKNIIGELNWDYEKLCSDKNNAVFCSVNPQHRILKSSLKEHEERCHWLQEGYQLDDKPFPEFSDNGFYTVLSPELQTQIIAVAASKTDRFELGNNKVDRPVPKTSNRLEQDFTRDERLAIYNYVIENTQRKGSFSDFTFLSPEEKNEKKKEMKQWEIAAAERDAKRRRASYRNKVHTNKKTHTEILREVIESQMECLKEEVLPKKEVLPKISQNPEREEEKKYKKHDDRSSHKHSKRYDNGHKDSHRHKKSHHHHHHHEKHKKSHKKRDRSTSRSRNKKHKRSVSRSRSREKYRKSSSKPYE